MAKQLVKNFDFSLKNFVQRITSSRILYDVEYSRTCNSSAILSRASTKTISFRRSSTSLVMIFGFSGSNSNADPLIKFRSNGELTRRGDLFFTFVVTLGGSPAIVLQRHNETDVETQIFVQWTYFVKTIAKSNQ